jgi:hypothetical protein
MLSVCRFYPGSSLLGLFLIACSASDLIEPSVEAASSAASSSNIKAPSGANTVSGSESRIDVSWKDNSTNESGFEVYRSNDATSGPFELRSITKADIISYSESGLSQSTQYCYKIRAFRTTGSKTSYSAYTNTACVTTSAALAPSGVDAKPARFARVDITWIDNSSIETGFRVERSLDLGSTWLSAGTVNPNVTSFSDSERASEQQVCYRVIAVMPQGLSPASIPDCTTPPAVPSSLTASALDGQTIDVTWIDNSAVEDGYEVQRSTAVFGTFVVVANLSQNTVSYRDAGLPDNATYFYRVRATKDGGFGDFSFYASAVLASASPSAPSGTGAGPNSSSVVAITWIDNSATEQGFRIERSTDGGASWAGSGTTSADETGFIDGERVSEERVCYRVFAFNSVGDSPPSDTGCTTPPAGPIDLTGTLVDPQTIELSWVDNSGVEAGYEVHFFFPMGDGTSQVIAELGPNSTVYHARVTCWGFDTFAVRAKKDGGFSDFSSSVTVETGSPCE